jgi:hypothetical protein
MLVRNDSLGRRASPDLAQQLVGWQTERIEAGRCSGDAAVAVVETTDLGLGHDPPLARWLDLPRPGSVATEGLVGPRVVVISEVHT